MFQTVRSNTYQKLRVHLNGINYIEFVDTSSKNDFDFGSYKRVSEMYPEDILFFLTVILIRFVTLG